MAVETRQRVLQVAREINYFSEQNLVASARMGRKTHTIAFVVGGMSRSSFSQHSFYQQLLLGVESEGGSRGKHLIFSCVENLAEALLAELYPKVEGLLLKGVCSREFVMQVAAKKPVVLLATTVPQTQVSEVSDDGRAGIFATTSYLVEQGHRRIAYVLRETNPLNVRLDQRYQGYADALAAHGLPIPPAYGVIPSFLQLATEIRSYERLWEILLALEPRPTALVCNADVTALFMIEAAHAKGIRIPEDVSVTGYDDVPEAARSRPPLTTVHVPYEELGRQAVRTLLTEIEKPQTPRQIIRLLPVLSERRSVARFDGPKELEESNRVQ